MADEDCIQYLGTKPATRPQLPSHPFLTNSQRPVTGLALHIEKTSTEAGHRIIFRKSEEPVVHIGRRPGSDSDKRKSEPGKAFFTCPVVSRHHAKIAFSDSGHIYLFDLTSHHGTHLRKREDVLSKRLNPETPTLLADGDGLVRPVVARVELLYGSQPPLKPLVVPDLSLSGAAEGQTHSPLRPPSGRYGVYVPASSEASSSSDELQSPQSHDSDIEEISGPAAALPPPWKDNSSDSTSPIIQKQILNCGQLSPFGAPGEFRAFSPGPQEIVRTSSPLFNRESFYNVGFDAYSNDIFEDDDNSEDSNSSRSTSPMDLSSSPEPSDPPAAENKASLIAVVEPVIIGAWPRSRSPSVFTSSFPPVRIVAPVEECAAATPLVNEPSPNNAPEAPDVAIAVEKDESETAVESSEVAQLKATLATIKAEVAKLQAHRRKYKQRFNDNVHATGDKFSDLEERTAEVHDLYNFLSDRLEENVDACHQAQAQVDALQGQMDATAEILPVAVTPVYADEAKASAKALEGLVAGVRDAQIALKSLTEEVEAHTTSLKRKRSEGAVDEAEPARKAAIAAESATPPPRKRARVGKVLVQTATAVTIGAVVTWSALAFS
ncbi:hypothetical protein B0H11DRAFT_2069910 [Mycena galericulata]|nr:hypothetical protein B0H11DRAFT_2069910 [Mycena galericulata]